MSGTTLSMIASLDWRSDQVFPGTIVSPIHMQYSHGHMCDQCILNIRLSVTTPVIHGYNYYLSTIIISTFLFYICDVWNKKRAKYKVFLYAQIDSLSAMTHRSYFLSDNRFLEWHFWYQKRIQRHKASQKGHITYRYSVTCEKVGFSRWPLVVISGLRVEI